MAVTNGIYAVVVLDSPERKVDGFSTWFFQYLSSNFGMEILIAVTHQKKTKPRHTLGAPLVKKPSPSWLLRMLVSGIYWLADTYLPFLCFFTATMTSAQEQPSNINDDHLGLSWEIGVIVGIVIIFVAVVAAAVFQCRRRRRLATNLAEDLEKTRRPLSSNPSPQSSLSSAILKETGESTKSTKEMPDLSGHTIYKPLPSASSSKRSSRIDHYPEHPLQKPPNYYWDHRL
ncbi:hypothetical protein J3R30DRAFT_3481959 [Lentinula aciculospora]|uniref:Uncharacterized protein n=1 Tax=Lentinula aciculospora TaxID=153920 RepID=A0A9W9AAU1_9AGAR|nr:hypothetical protein J3R30DRAFT_3481959 [Lentinula aciculospora]